jgi:ferredoxin
VKRVLLRFELRYDALTREAFMRILVDPDLCEGFGMCTQLLPDVFTLGDELPVQIAADAAKATLRAKLQDAVDHCPRNALRIEDD